MSNYYIYMAQNLYLLTCFNHPSILGQRQSGWGGSETYVGIFPVLTGQQQCPVCPVIPATPPCKVCPVTPALVSPTITSNSGKWLIPIWAPTLNLPV